MVTRLSIYPFLIPWRLRLLLRTRRRHKCLRQAIEASNVKVFRRFHHLGQLPSVFHASIYCAHRHDELRKALSDDDEKNCGGHLMFLGPAKVRPDPRGQSLKAPLRLEIVEAYGAH